MCVCEGERERMNMNVAGEKTVMEMELVPAKIHFILAHWTRFKPRFTKLSLFF